VGELRRIMVSVPLGLLQEIDGIVAKENRNRSEFIREAVRLYLTERKQRDFYERMRVGYLEMSRINLALAEESAALEDEVARLYDVRLAECE
jgi:CopG family transcriptional regulator/antitoxin EndoAI